MDNRFDKPGVNPPEKKNVGDTAPAEINRNTPASVNKPNNSQPQGIRPATDGKPVTPANPSPAVRRPMPQQGTPVQRSIPQNGGTPVRPAERTVRTDGQPVNADPAKTAQIRPSVPKTPVQGTNARPISAETVALDVPVKADDGATRISEVTPKLASAEKTSALNAEAKRNGKKGKNRDKKQSGYTEANNTVVSLIKCMAYITVVFVISIIISVTVILAANDIYGFVKSTDPVEVTIPEGATKNDIADILYDNNVIKYKWLFKVMTNDYDDFCAGTYTISPQTSYDDLIDEFREKIPTGVSWVTIPEGFTTDEIIDLLVEKGIGEREKYVEVINNHEFDYWFVEELGEDWAADGRIYRLDGYLFPDTYQFYNASSEALVIDKLLSRFDQVFVESYRERAAELGYTVDEILTLASLIEKEAANQSEFADVSSVFHNRLNNSANYPYLESDATIVYAIQHETGARPNLTGEDLQMDNPYNSYKYRGLVPGPIASPSNSAILAALNPKNTNYYFFVSNGQRTYFARNLQEHNQNKAMYLKGNSGN